MWVNVLMLKKIKDKENSYKFTFFGWRDSYDKYARRKLIIANFTIVSYFVLIWLINVYKIDIVLIGVFRELLTIPFLIAQIVFLVIGIYF